MKRGTVQAICNLINHVFEHMILHKAKKATSHSKIFDIPMHPVHEDQIMLTKKRAMHGGKL